MLYFESSDHVTDDVTWPQKVKAVTQISLKLDISKTVRNGCIATKLAHDGPQYSPHPRCTLGQGQCKRSRDTGTSVMSRNVCYTVPSDVLSLHAVSLCEVPLHCPSAISVRQPDVMSASWNELLRRFQCVRSPLTWYINFSFVHLQYITSYVCS